mmetsp:Transcript_55914/g.105315  ORF Transcript_55914/g.105315 Transcript_55914/m.105315 type:complete len:274 (-) Transcript_55914:29-850(-)
MHRITLLLAFLASTGHGKQQTLGDNEMQGSLPPSEALAMLLLAHPEAADAFNPSAVQFVRGRPAVPVRSCRGLQLCEGAAEPAAEEAPAEGEEAPAEEEGEKKKPWELGPPHWPLKRGDPGWLGPEKKMALITDKWKKDDSEIPILAPGDSVRVTSKLGETTKKGRDRLQKFEGVIIAIRKNRQWEATIVVRRLLKGYGVERTYPIHSPNVVSIEVLKHAYVRRKKLYYLRNILGKKARLKERPEGAPARPIGDLWKDSEFSKGLKDKYKFGR